MLFFVSATPYSLRVRLENGVRTSKRIVSNNGYRGKRIIKNVTFLLLFNYVDVNIISRIRS